jgi:hypothetical protein
MRIIIYLASHDDAAFTNYRKLLANRRKTYNNHQMWLEVRDERLIQDPKNKEDVFAGLLPNRYSAVKIELIAHGNPSHRYEILSQRMDPAVKPNEEEKPITKQAEINKPVETQASSMKMKLIPDATPVDERKLVSSTNI